MQKTNETVLEIDLNALDNNYRYIASKLKPSTKIMAVVKAFGYGTDSVAIAKELEDLNTDYFAVAYLREGEVLRNASIQTPILVLHPLQQDFETIVNRCLEPNIYSLKMLEAFIAFAEKKNQKYFPIHIKIDTGLKRLGFVRNELDAIIKAVSKTTSVKIKSIFSHLAASEDLEERKFTLQQITDFETASKYLISKLGYSPLLHCANTSGIFNYPEAHFDMVRTGIGLYGFGNDKKENKHLIPVGTLKTVISQIHDVAQGESVGYNRKFVATKKTRIATLPLGHADGISRSYGNGKGYVTIHGEKASIVGNVCMDMIMVNISDIDCKEGDEVIVFGNDPHAESLAALANSISYELITGISQRVNRTICRK